MSEMMTIKKEPVLTEKQKAWLVKAGADPTKYNGDMATVVLSVYFGTAKLDLEEQDQIKRDLIVYLAKIGYHI